MADYIFQEGEQLPELKTDFDTWLFHERKKLLMQSHEGWHSFIVINAKYNTIAAHCPIHISDELARSPVRSPFGSFQVSDDLDPSTMFGFVDYIHSYLKKKGVKKIVIKNPPDAYQSYQAPILNTILLNQGYHVSNAEIGALIPVSNEPFLANIDRWEVRKSRQAQAEGLSFFHDEHTALEEIFMFIKLCRDERGYELSMALEEIKTLVDAFPESYTLFSVRDSAEIVAAAVCIKINKSIMYTFYYAHTKTYDRLSPVVMLLEYIYTYCQQQGISLLDLGTSAVDGKPNFNVLDFKLRLGAKPATKLILEKEF